MRNRAVFAVLILGLLVVAGWMSTPPKAAPALSADDAHEIRQLYATMYQGSDFRDADLWLSTFAEDGVFIFPNGDQVAGKQALREWRQRTFRGEVGDSGRRHSFTTIRMTASPDGGATARAYWIELDVKSRPSAIRN
nr:SgcJ/EcaC family oxidoreductase [Desulfuromonadales bacterium]